jgi:hypothetical protein
MAVPLPYRLLLMMSMASSKLSAFKTTRTGPKISWLFAFEHEQLKTRSGKSGAY